MWLPDVFGYSAALPQIMRRSGIRWFLTQKLSWNQYNVLPHHSFLWEGIDGSRVFTHFPPADTYSGNVSVRELRFGVENFKDHDRATRSLYLFGWGDGGGGPTSEMLESARRLADIDGLPRLTMEGPRAVLHRGGGRDRRPRRSGSGELYLELHRGTYTSQAATKLGNRRAEFALRDAELWASLAPGLRLPGATELDELWKLLLLHQFHDIIPGSGIHWVYEDTARDHARILSETGRLIDDALDAARRRHRHDGPRPPGRRVQLALPRPHASWSPSRRPTERRRRPSTPPGPTGPVQRDGDGRAVFEADRARLRLPGLRPGGRRPAGDRHRGRGRRRVASRTTTCASSSTTRACSSSIFDKSAGRQVLAPGAAGQPLPAPPRLPQLLRRLGHRPLLASTRSVDLDEVESVDVVEQGPLRAGIRVARRFGDSRLDPGHPAGGRVARRRLRHRGGMARDQPAPQGRLPRRRAQPPGHLRDPVRPRGAARPTPTPAGTSPASRSAPTSGPTSPSPGTAWPCSTTASTATTSPATSSACRCCAPRPGPTPWPTAATTASRYRLLPHAGDLRDAGVIDAGYDLNVPLRAVAASPHAGHRGRRARSLLSVDAPNVVVEVVKRSDDGPARSWSGSTRHGGDAGPVTLRAPWTRRPRPLTDLLERAEADTPASGCHGDAGD